jgi:hypothetical protein
MARTKRWTNDVGDSDATAHFYLIETRRLGPTASQRVRCQGSAELGEAT